MDTLLILIGSGCLLCLVPLALYLLYLSSLNSRPQPVLIPGSWDFAALLMGLSGFLLLSGPLLISLVDSTWRGYAHGNWANLRSIGRGEALAGSLLATGYFVFLLGAIPLLVRSRRRVTAIYNVQAENVAHVVRTLLTTMGYPWKGEGKSMAIVPHRLTGEAPASAGRFGQAAGLTLEATPSLAHCTLRWSGEYETLRDELEAALQRELAGQSPRRNPLSGWLFTAGVTLSVIMIVWLAVLIFLVVTPPPPPR